VKTKSDGKATARSKKLLIIGHGRHGKDTVAEMLQHHFGYLFKGSSEWCAEHVIFPAMADRYDSWEDCFNDRAQHRSDWFNLIRDYNNLTGNTKIALGVLAESNVYVGMRSRVEYEATRNLFDHVVWVDRSEHLPLEPRNSMELTINDADLFVDNNGNHNDLFKNVVHLVQQLEEK
jgi:hypothetical protein